LACLAFGQPASFTTEEVRMPAGNIRENNFDLIRLFAAFQVVVGHASQHLKIELGSIFKFLLDIFPGVPIFFFISGFLISRSFEKNSRLDQYFLNRGLRLFPGLWTCFLISVLLVWVTGYFDDHPPTFAGFAAWAAAQLTFFQFYSADFLREFGCGVLNGSLWTISVEIQFYILVPVLYWLFRLKTPGKNGLLIALTAFFALFNYVYLKGFLYEETLAGKLFGVSFLPWFYMFLVGVLVQRNFLRVITVFQGRGLYMVVIYVAACVLANEVGLTSSGNQIHLVQYLLLTATMLSCAYTRPSFSERYLRGNDISYGIYIYHMPVINLAIYFGLTGRADVCALCVAAVIAMGLVSWFFVEKPMMKRKKNAFRPT
jgi:peptidoglycan/LPS O-acetylase OafA/YrhL